MSKFRIGDKVRIITHRKVDQYGKESVITTDEDLYDGEQSWALKGSPWRWKEGELELVQSSPVRTRIVTEIVEGNYGKVEVGAADARGRRRIFISSHFGKDELTEVISTLTVIRNALEGGAA